MAMVYSTKDMAKALKELIGEGVDFVIVGDTIVQLEMGKKSLKGDVDLFIINPSPFVEEDFYRALAEKHGWYFSYTDLGTPRLIAHVDGKDIELELYENIHDFYIPIEIINEARKIKLHGIDVKLLHVEDYVLLKARAGSPDDIEKLSKVLGELKKEGIKLNTRILRQHLRYFPDEDRQVIVNRISSLGVKL